MDGRPIRRIFHRSQNVPASCERSLRLDFVECTRTPASLGHFENVGPLFESKIVSLY